MLEIYLHFVLCSLKNTQICGPHMSKTDLGGSILVITPIRKQEDLSRLLLIVLALTRRLTIKLSEICFYSLIFITLCHCNKYCIYNSCLT